MARPVRGCPTTRPQQEGTEEPEQDPQQENQSDTTEGKDTADYDLDVDYEGSEPDVVPVAQVEREVDPDAQYANMDIPCDGTLHQRMMPEEQYKEILQAHRTHGPEIMALKLQDTYMWLGCGQVACQREKTRQSR